ANKIDNGGRLSLVDLSVRWNGAENCKGLLLELHHACEKAPASALKSLASSRELYQANVEEVVRQLEVMILDEPFFPSTRLSKEPRNLVTRIGHILDRTSLGQGWRFLRGRKPIDYFIDATHEEVDAASDNQKSKKEFESAPQELATDHV